MGISSKEDGAYKVSRQPRNTAPRILFPTYLMIHGTILILNHQFVRNKVLRYWMDNRGQGKAELFRYNTDLRAEYEFVKELNSHACQTAVERVLRSITKFFDNCKRKIPGRKADATPRRRQAQTPVPSSRRQSLQRGEPPQRAALGTRPTD